MTAPDLLPCPFCGYEPDGYEGTRVSCRCGAMGPHEVAGDPESPTWSTRADLATPAAMTPEVRAIVEAAEKTRAAQKAYFRDRTRENLIASKQAEAELDAALAALRAGGAL